MALDANIKLRAAKAPVTNFDFLIFSSELELILC